MPRKLALFAAAVLAAVAVTVAGMAATASATAQPVLLKITTGHHYGFDRVTFTFAGPLPAERSWSYVPQLIADPSGKVIPLEGRAVVRVRFFSATTWVTATRTPRLREIRQIKPAGNFEGVVTYGIGVTKAEPVTMHTLTGPARGLNRVYFDIRTP